MIGSKNDCIKFLIDAPDCQYEVREHHEKRSINANSYYWALIAKLAPKIPLSTTQLHNRIIRDYGQREFIEGRVVNVVIPDTEDAEEKALSAETYHIKPTSQVINGYRNYVMMRGSSTYDTKEMSILLDGLVEECRQAKIDTMTQEEMEKLKGYEKQTKGK